VTQLQQVTRSAEGALPVPSSRRVTGSTWETHCSASGVWAVPPGSTKTEVRPPPPSSRLTARIRMILYGYTV